jgi:hypothetical protein
MERPVKASSNKAAVDPAAGLPESGTVQVACKMPNGIKLRLFAMEDTLEPIAGGATRTVKRARAVGEPVTLNGNALAFGQIPEYKIIGGYAITEDVDAQFFAEWLRQNADSDIVKNRLVFAYEKASDLSAAARELRGQKSGLEPISQGGDARLPKDVRKVEKTDKEAA